MFLLNFFSFITLDNLRKIATFIIPIIATYLITRYSTNRPKKLLIKERQFSEVYLPLYKSLCLNSTDELSRTQLIKYDIKLQSILHEHYELAFPTLHNLSDDFHEIVKNKQENYTQILEKIRYQICKDYELLRQDLGYPAQNIFTTLQRMTLMDRIEYIINHFHWIQYAISTLSITGLIIGIWFGNKTIIYASFALIGLYIALCILFIIILSIVIVIKNNWRRIREWVSTI